jgi:hypothetical protein
MAITTGCVGAFAGGVVLAKSPAGVELTIEQSIAAAMERKGCVQPDIKKPRRSSDRRGFWWWWRGADLNHRPSGYETKKSL